MCTFIFKHDSQPITFTESEDVTFSHVQKYRDERTRRLSQLQKHRQSVAIGPITGNPVIDAMNLTELESRRDLRENVRTRRAYEIRRKSLARQQAEAVTAALYERREVFRAARRAKRLETRGGLMTESKEIGDMSMDSASNMDSHENVVDHTGEEINIKTLGVNIHKTDDGGNTQFSLESFFERPVSIYDSTWNSGTEYNVALQLWNLWSKDSSVRAKLTNYSYFRGTLHVKIATTGTPYHYGRIMAAYYPYARYNDVLGRHDDLLASTTPGPTTTLPLYKCYLSQTPGVSYIDVKENEPQELIIPFISHKPKFRLFNDDNNVITNATEFSDFEEAGELRLVTLNQLNVANADFDSAVSLNVYAWVTDIELGNITATDMNITAQSKDIFTEARHGRSSHREPRRHHRRRRDPSPDPPPRIEIIEEEESSEDDYYERMTKDEGTRRINWRKSKKDKPMYSKTGNFGSRLMTSLEKGGDEYSEPGPVSNVATAVAKVGDALTDVPVIGGFAKATSTVAKSIGKVASWFGWAKPVVLTDPTFVKNMPFQNGATTIGKDTCFKLTLDPKQELSVDQTLGGVEEDQMMIAEIAKRESFLTTFTWSDDNVAMTTLLWKCLVSPILFQSAQWTDSGLQAMVQPTSLMFAAQPFQSWRGKIKFRFEIVCSKFHRGKILFKYDPNVAMNGLISSNTTKLNQQNTVILDIQDTQDITFEVDWAHVRNWAQVPQNFASDALPCNTENFSADYSVYDANECNGFIEVRPLNELVQPTSTSTVAVNVFVSCDDLVVNRPSTALLPYKRAVNFTESSDITTEEVINHNDSKINEKIFLDHYGERVFSFRSLLKRYTTSAGGHYTNGITGNGFIDVSAGLYPQDGLPVPFEASSDCDPKTLFSYLRYAYMGVRGGMRYRVIVAQGDSSARNNYTRVQLLSPRSFSDTAMGVTTKALNNTAAIWGTGDYFYTNRLDGGVLYHMATNGGIEFEVPFYSRNLFLFACNNNFGLNVTDEPGIGFDTIMGAWDWSCKTAANFANNSYVSVTVDSATAEDFTFLRYQGAPFYTESADISDQFYELAIDTSSDVYENFVLRSIEYERSLRILIDVITFQNGT